MKSLTENDILDLYRYFCWSTAPTPGFTALKTRLSRHDVIRPSK